MLLFVFGSCTIFLFKSYPYNMAKKQLCQQLFKRKLKKFTAVENLASVRGSVIVLKLDNITNILPMFKK